MLNEQAAYMYLPISTHLPKSKNTNTAGLRFGLLRYPCSISGFMLDTLLTFYLMHNSWCACIPIAQIRSQEAHKYV